MGCQFNSLNWTGLFCLDQTRQQRGKTVVRGDSEDLEAEFTGGFGMPGMIVHEEDAFGGRLAESDRCLKDLGSGFYESGFP